MHLCREERISLFARLNRLATRALEVGLGSSLHGRGELDIARPVISVGEDAVQAHGPFVVTLSLVVVVEPDPSSSSRLNLAVPFHVAVLAVELEVAGLPGGSVHRYGLGLLVRDGRREGVALGVRERTGGGGSRGSFEQIRKVDLDTPGNSLSEGGGLCESTISTSLQTGRGWKLTRYSVGGRRGEPL